MTGELVLQERDGARDVVRMVLPDPPESDTIVKRAAAWRREYYFAGRDEQGRPVYAAR